MKLTTHLMCTGTEGHHSVRVDFPSLIDHPTLTVVVGDTSALMYGSVDFGGGIA